jgi:hypothetical protein
MARRRISSHFIVRTVSQTDSFGETEHDRAADNKKTFYRRLDARGGANKFPRLLALEVFECQTRGPPERMVSEHVFETMWIDS